MAKKVVTAQQLQDIKKLFESDLTNKNKLGLSLVNKAIFMEQTLDKLQEKIEKDGVVTTMCQGSYEIERENPALKSYTGLIKNFNTIMKQILDLLPSDEQKEDAFDSFE